MLTATYQNAGELQRLLEHKEAPSGAVIPPPAAADDGH